MTYGRAITGHQLVAHPPDVDVAVGGRPNRLQYQTRFQADDIFSPTLRTPFANHTKRCTYVNLTTLTLLHRN
jgi:hypothetical protein